MHARSILSKGSPAVPARGPLGATAASDHAALAAVIRRTAARVPWLAWLALAVGLAASVIATRWVQEEIEHEPMLAFDTEAQEIVERIEDHAASYRHAIFAMRGLFDASPDTTRTEFYRFASDLVVDHELPGVLRLSYARLVRATDRTAFEARMTGEGVAHLSGLPPFRIKAGQAAEEYLPVIYVEPLVDTAVLAVDLLEDPARVEAVQVARDSGLLSASSAMPRLAGSNATPATITFRLATYAGGGVSPTLDGRRRAFAGLAGITVDFGAMVRAALPADALDRLNVRIEDITKHPQAPMAGGIVLFDNAAGTGRTVAPDAKYAATNTFLVADRELSMTITPRVKVGPPIGEWVLSYFAGLLVAVASLLVFGLVRALAAAEERGVSLSQSMRRLEFNRTRLAETQEIANIGGFEFDKRSEDQTWSDQLYRILGRRVGDPPHPDRDFFYANVVHHADASRVRDAMRRVLEDRGPVALECRVMRADGVQRMVSTVARLETAEDGTRTRVIGTVRDITDEWQASERERAQLQFVQTMIDAIPIPVYQKDLDGRYRASNDAWCHFLGLPREKVVGHSPEEVFHGASLAAVYAQDRRLLSGAGKDIMEIDLPNAAGELRHVLLHKASYVGPDGTIAGLVGAAYDVTELKQTRERLELTITELARRNRVATLLGEFGEALQACLELGETYEAIEKFLPRLVPGSAGVVYRLGAGKGNAERSMSWGHPVGAVEVMSSSDCLAIRRGQPRCVQDSQSELNCHHLEEMPASYACLPLSSHGELFGLLHVQRGSAASSTCELDTEWPALRNAAEHISLALANLAIRESLREQATRDKLTGLYNRHYLNARFQQELARARRTPMPMGVVMFDIDHFKRFNDTFGHAAGDHVLHEIGNVLLSAARRSDVPCRYGGEEFLLFMPDATREVAQRRAEQVRLDVRSLSLEYDGQPIGPLTISAGVAGYPDDGDSADSLIKRADRALYRAKELGRDRVEVAMPAAPPEVGPLAVRQT